MDILQTAETLIARHRLCDSCLGRQFARLGRGVENSERGRVLRALLKLSPGDRETKRQEIEDALASGDFQKLNNYADALRSEVPECFLCEGIIPHAGDYVEVALSALKSSPYEYETFLLGCKVPGRILEREDNLRAELRLE